MPSGDGDVVRPCSPTGSAAGFPQLDHFHPEVELLNHCPGAASRASGAVRRLIGDRDDAFAAGRSR